jgi:site-specific recombinase XerC
MVRLGHQGLPQTPPGTAFAQASLVRIYATVRHFARWLHRKFPNLFPLGCPTDGVKPPAEPTVDWKGLTRTEGLRLLNAAQTLRVRPGPSTKQGGQLRGLVPEQRDPRAMLDQWLKQRGDNLGPLFPTRSRRRLSRREVANIMQRVAARPMPIAQK